MENEGIDPAKFRNYFTLKVQFVQEKCLNGIEWIILLSSYLDALAGYRYGGKSSSDRFDKFLTTDTDQSHAWKKVSLILLRQHLEATDTKRSQKLIGLLNQLGAHRRSYIEIDHNPDIDVSSLLKLCSDQLPEFSRVEVERLCNRFKYSYFFWHDYRNSSIHEAVVANSEYMSIPNFNKKIEPYYGHMNYMGKGKITMQKVCFCFPPEFLIKTIESGIKRVALMAQNDKIDLKFPSKRIAY